MRICVDVDGTICELRGVGQGYADFAPRPGALEKLRTWRSQGHQIVLLTARHMKAAGHNTGLVFSRQGKTLLDWLDKYDVPHGELWFGKPWADLYIDDNGLRLDGSWLELPDNAMDLPQSKELSLRRGASSVAESEAGADL